MTCSFGEPFTLSWYLESCFSELFLQLEGQRLLESSSEDKEKKSAYASLTQYHFYCFEFVIELIIRHHCLLVYLKCWRWNRTLSSSFIRGQKLIKIVVGRRGGGEYKMVCHVSRWCSKYDSLNVIGQSSLDSIGWKTRVKFVISHWWVSIRLLLGKLVGLGPCIFKSVC